MSSKKIFKNFCITLILAIIGFSFWAIFTPMGIPQIRQYGRYLGIISAILFCFTITPGLVRRSNINFLGQIPSHLLYARAQLGLSMFFSGLGHYALIAIIPAIRTGRQPNFQPFYIFGLMALFLSLWLALTSNQFSKKILKKHWKTLHSLVYVIVWMIFLHVALIDFSPLSILLGFFAIAETLSLIFDQSKKKINS
jgi:DMSO/TMAO reductase YedYZ heme-binding membrane subunit